MIHILENTYNEDTKIQEIQKRLYEGLTSIWKTNKLDAYGRVYKNEKKKGIIPEVYNANTKDYKETYYSNQSCFFFVDGDYHKSEDDVVFTTDLKVVFMLNLEDVTFSTERADADVKRDVVSILREFEGVFYDFEYMKGVKNVLKEFDLSTLNYNDMQPLHVFAISGTLSYYINDKCN